ncbi:MAG: deoxyribose-phosphate aldolase [Candidatus Odinarchaeota archaeon]|nr:deoxyribose-phosphate aldolase [Candidatus Odinarchaeota archaeon]
MRKLTSWHLAKVFSTAIIQPNTSASDVVNFVSKMKQYPFASIGVDTYHLPLLVKLLKDTEIDVTCAIAYPMGGLPIELKVKQVKWAVEHGADEVDVVMNISAFKSGKYDYVRKEMEEIVKAAEGKIVKIMPCTVYLTPEEIRHVARMMVEAGVTMLKTNAGYGQITKYNDVKVAKEEVGDNLFVMAAGGLRNADIALGMIRAGADRIDSGTPQDIFNTLDVAQRTYTDEELEAIIKRIEEMNEKQPKIRRKIYD